MDTTIILTVSRDDFLEEVVSSIESMGCSVERTAILCVVDGDKNLFVKTRNIISGTKFSERLTYHFPAKRKTGRYDVMGRRRRIAEIHKYAKDIVQDSSYVLLVEDDTVIPKNTLNRLKATMQRNQGAAIVEGVELGRHGVRHVGAWVFDDIYNPTEVSSPEFKDSGEEFIDATGFYCTLIRADIYKSHQFELHESLGPDISMGLALRQSGYTNLINWSVKCRHLNIGKGNEKEVLYPDATAEVVTLKRVNSNNWAIKY